MKAEIYNYQIWLNLTENKKLKKYIHNVIAKSDFNIFNFCEHYFVPNGYTAIWLLGESHCAIHTFPEEKRAYLELSSCSKKKYEKFVSILNNSDYIFRKVKINNE